MGVSDSTMGNRDFEICVVDTATGDVLAENIQANSLYQVETLLGVSNDGQKPNNC